MKKLLKNKKGFTLMEMLIVVAIIVILVAVSIPTFSGQLDNAKAATDAANLRAAKAVAQNFDMMDSWADEVDSFPESGDATLTYDIDSGKFVVDGSKVEYYGNGDNTIITVTIEDGKMVGQPDWANNTSSSENK